MKKLCLGTLLRILCDAKYTNEKQYILINALLSSVKNDSSYKDDKFQSALLSGKNNLTHYSEIIAFDKAELRAIFENKIKPFYDENWQKVVIVCIQDVLKEDISIKDSDNIGFETEGFTKQDIVNKQVFSFTDLLVNVYYYCTVVVNNIPYKTNIAEIRDYTKKQYNRRNEVQLETAVSRVTSKVKLTLTPQPFNDVFTQVKDIKLTIPNPNEMKIYRLDVSSSKIDYTRLQSFIADNIGRYVYSRGMRNRYNLKADSMELAIKTLKAYNKRIKTVPSTNHFNELMLYSFLECVLGAPKIFSKMELQDKSGVYDSISSGIHINTYKNGGVFFNQLVFGATDTIDNLETAVDNALSQVMSIKAVSHDEYEFLENTILNNEFDPETNKILENMIIPKKGSGLSKPDDAFGLFLGYTVSTIFDPNNVTYISNLEKQMESDILRIAVYLENKIKILGLMNHSFYVYVLPLNNAIFDKNGIMKDALGVDE